MWCWSFNRTCPVPGYPRQPSWHWLLPALTPRCCFCLSSPERRGSWWDMAFERAGAEGRRGEAKRGEGGVCRAAGCARNEQPREGGGRGRTRGGVCALLSTGRAGCQGESRKATALPMSTGSARPASPPGWGSAGPPRPAFSSAGVRRGPPVLRGGGCSWIKISRTESSN